MPDPPRFVCFAGLDGSGKTTHAVRFGREYGYRYVWARWTPFLTLPLRLAYGRLALKRRDGLLDADGAAFEASRRRKRRLLASRAVRGTWLAAAEIDYLLQLARKSLRRGRRVCDRYVYDFYIDQLINAGLGPERLEGALRRRMLSRFPRPDVVVYIAVSPETGAARKLDGTTPEYLAARVPYYRALCRVYPSVVVDGERDAERVYEEIRAALGFPGGRT